MRLRKGAITGQQRVFAKAMAATHDTRYAATKAKYKHPDQSAWMNMQNPDVVEEIRKQARNRLRTEGAEVGVDTLISIAKDDKQPAGARATAATNLVKLANLQGDDAAGADKDLSEMTGDEISALLERARQALNDRAAGAKTIEHKPAAPAPKQIERAPALGLFD